MVVGHPVRLATSPPESAHFRGAFRGSGLGGMDYLCNVCGVHAIPPSGVFGARPLGVPGLRYPGAACDKRIGVEVRAAMLLVGRRKSRFTIEPTRVFR